MWFSNIPVDIMLATPVVFVILPRIFQRTPPTLCINCKHPAKLHDEGKAECEACRYYKNTYPDPETGHHKDPYHGCSQVETANLLDKDGYLEPIHARCFCDWSYEKVMANVPKQLTLPKPKVEDGVLQQLAKEYYKQKSYVFQPTKTPMPARQLAQKKSPELGVEKYCGFCGTTYPAHEVHNCVKMQSQVRGQYTVAHTYMDTKHFTTYFNDLGMPVYETAEEIDRPGA
jgi:hypothetical protein